MYRMSDRLNDTQSGEALFAIAVISHVHRAWNSVSTGK